MRQPVPILMYHKVGQAVDGPSDTFLNVSALDFRRQMSALERLGYRARPFAEVVNAMTRGRTLPPRTFSVTFDDGYACIGDVAAPILAEFGFPATVFVVSGHVGRQNEWDAAAGRPVVPLMDWQHLSGLKNIGWEIAGHTFSHPHLDSLDDDQALREVCRGKRNVEDRLGIVMETFCYPFGHLNSRTAGLVRRAGFIGACTTRSGLARPLSDPFLAPRVKVAYSDGVSGLLYRLLLRPRLPNLRRGRRSELTGA